jgi:hypothetical protein
LNARLHGLNLQRHRRTENWLWRPDTQERKLSESSMVNLRYRCRWKRQWLGRFLCWLAEAIPYCEVRYAF